MNIFEESLSILKSKVQLRKLFQDMHVEDIESVIKRVEAIHDEKVREHEEQREEQGRKREAIENILGQMQEKGVSVEDLMAFGAVEKVRKGKPRQRYQFEYEKEDGSVLSWAGSTVGRIPSDFSEYLSRTGKERKDCIVAEL
ncbi:H-NS family nucleoid-associated regulatory protein [Endozoicomonas sp. 4G]|uniref:H-NS family histone-like protein n=1 Tax=Endozoicomonas sp. 4G TaxID=2872754 RepID=UPI002078BD04|nr:H-NS family nucleoid-associated regulatory protein [Endozoicomonas sp. 4G]